MVIHEIIYPKVANKIFGRIVGLLQKLVAISSKFGFGGRGGGGVSR